MTAQNPIAASRNWRLKALPSGLAVTATLAAAAAPASAATAGGTMPWDNLLTTVQADITGPVATTVGVVACVVFGLSMAFGHEGSSMRRGMSILFGLAIAFTSASGILSIFGAGSGAVF